MNQVNLRVMFPSIGKTRSVPVSSVDITVREMTDMVGQKEPQLKREEHGLFLTIQGQESLLSPDLLLSSYDIFHHDAVLLYKPLPQLVTIVFTKRYLIDRELPISELMHLLINESKFSPQNETILLSNDQLSETISISDFADISAKELKKKFIKLKKRSTLYENIHMIEQESDKDIVLICPDNSENIPLLSIPPPSLQKKGPKQKRGLSYMNRTLMDTDIEIPDESVIQSSKQQQQQQKQEEEMLKSPRKTESHSEAILPHTKLELTERDSDPILTESSAPSTPRSASKPTDKRLKSFLSFRNRKEKPESATPEPPVSAREKKQVEKFFQSYSERNLASLIPTNPNVGFFGVPLAVVMSRDNEMNNTIPSIVSNMISYLEKCGLETEGIFRVCAAQEHINQLIKRYNLGENVNLNAYDVHTVANTLKYYVQVLPNPLLTYELYPRFMAAICLADKDLRLSYYRALFAALPKMRFDLCMRLLSLLRKVAEKHSVNKMDYKNLSIVLGPLLLRNRETSKDVYVNCLHYSKYLIKFGRHLLANYTRIFGEPAEPLMTIRATISCTAARAFDMNVKENSIIHIFSKNNRTREWYAESEGRFGTLPDQFMNGGEANYIKETIELDPSVLPTLRPPLNRRGGSSLASPNGALQPRKMHMLNEREFLSVFSCSKEIFLLLPKWKQDAMLKEVGLLAPTSSASITSGEPKYSSSRTIPVGTV